MKRCAATAPTASSAPLAAGAVAGAMEAAAVEVAEVRLPRRRRRPRRHRRRRPPLLRRLRRPHRRHRRHRRAPAGGSACRPDFIPAIPTLGVTATATGRPPSAPLNTAPRTASAGAAVAASPNPRPPPGAATRARPPSQPRWRSPPWLGSPSTAGATGRARRATLPTSRAALKRREPVNAVNLPSTCRRPPLRATGRDLRSLARARSDSR